VDARAQQGEGLDHPLHMRVLQHLAVDRQAAGDARVALGEFVGLGPQEGQFPFVVGQKILHERSLCGCAQWARASRRLTA
jgi:hypothetical protein